MALLHLFLSCEGGRVHLMRSSKRVEFVSPITYVNLSVMHLVVRGMVKNYKVVGSSIKTINLNFLH